MAQMFPAMAAGLGTAGAAAGATAAAGGMSTAVLGISAALSIGSALMSIGQGAATKKRKEEEAAFALTEAYQEEAQGAAKARDLAKEYSQLVNEQTVIQFANGLDIGVGSPVSVRESSRKIAERNLDVTRQTARNRASMARLRSRGLLAEGKAAMTEAIGNAMTTGLGAVRMLG